MEMTATLEFLDAETNESDITAGDKSGWLRLEKQVDAEGNTLQYTKTTFTRDGQIETIFDSSPNRPHKYYFPGD